MKYVLCGFIGLVIGVEFAIIIWPIGGTSTTETISLIIGGLVAIATAGCWYAAHQSARAVRQSNKYLSWINQPYIEFTTWKVYTTEKNLILEYNFSLKGKEPIVLRAAKLSFYGMDFREKKTCRIYDPLGVKLYPDNPYHNSMSYDFSTNHFEHTIQGWNSDNKKESQLAKMRLSTLLLLVFEYRRIATDKWDEFVIPLYHFHAEDKPLTWSDYGLFQDKIPDDFRKELGKYMGENIRRAIN
jgi:4-amino-4-deoxy-L-arabinose transferase-like glycosyltransferase